MKTYCVCSDHFNDSDYNKNDFNVMKLLGYEKRMRLRLNPEAVPNTHPEKDELLLFLNGKVQNIEEETAARTNRSRVNRRNVRYILPACVVSAIRERFPNPDGIPYTGYISLKTNEGHNLP